MKKIVILAVIILMSMSSLLALDLSYCEGHAYLDDMTPHNLAEFGFEIVEYTEISNITSFSGHTEQECRNAFDNYTGTFTYYFNVPGQTNSGTDAYDETDGYFLMMIGGFIDESGFGVDPGTGIYNDGTIIFQYNFVVLAEVTYYGNDDGLRAPATLVEYITYTEPNAYYDLGDVIFGSGGMVPVVLSDFATAVFENEFVQINWTTQSAANMNLWNLYRDEIIIHTEEAVNGTEPHEYIYEDTYVTIGETYTYYLEAVDNDGTTTMFGPVSATMTGEEIPELPTETELFGNYPNPFNPVTEIKFNVKADETAKLTIFDVKGRVVANAIYGPGAQSFVWEANTSASGVYFYKLESQSTTSVKKMMLLK